MAEGIRPYRRGEVRAYPIGAAQDFVAGRVVTLTAGEVTEAADTVAAADVLGVALDPAVWPNAMPALTQGVVPVKDQLVIVALAKDNQEYVGFLIDGESVAVADVGGTDIGIITVDGVHRISKAGATKVGEITELVDPVGTAGGRVVFRFLSTVVGPFTA